MGGGSFRRLPHSLVRHHPLFIIILSVPLATSGAGSTGGNLEPSTREMMIGMILTGLVVRHSVLRSESAASRGLFPCAERGRPDRRPNREEARDHLKITAPSSQIMSPKRENRPQEAWPVLLKETPS